ncbi:helix-turn-helix transcriptional regulator [Anabaena sp. CCY 0017]|uniref:helix-turn-helix transcriptional regulator n=1 Tax=Anabaena sp. CCY 0017 TaxID=3103866 RepID=UPI0039C5D175
MMEVITAERLEEIEQESLKQSETVKNTFNEIKKWDSKFSNGYCQLVQLRPGLNLSITDETYYQPINCHNNHYGFYELTSKFYLSGNHGVICPSIAGVKDNYQEIAGNNYLFYLPDIEEIEQNFSGDRIYLIKICLDLDLLKSFMGGRDSIPKQLRPLLESDSAPRFHQPVGKITSSMQTALQQIIHVPFDGMLQRIYLEGKVLELLALQFAQLIDSDSAKKPLINLKAADIEKIYQARDILTRNYEHPPSLLDLAQKIGINDNKLKYGFKEIFGTTVFGYLRDYRLEIARKLLQEQKQNVRTVVNTVGYANQSHFAAAFKRKFGITPQDCRLGKKAV